MTKVFGTYIDAFAGKGDIFNRRIVRYIFMMGVCYGALVLAHCTARYINGAAFDFFLGAVFLSAYYAGPNAGLLASITSIIAIDFFFISPIDAFKMPQADFLKLSIFSAVAVTTTLLTVRFKRARIDLKNAHEKLEMRVRRRTEELSLANQRLKKEIAQRARAEQAILEISNREQRRLGQDLHDGLCQILAGVKLTIESVKEKTSKASGLFSDMELIEIRVRDALTQADTISRGLYPIELETKGLGAALEELAHKTTRMHRIPSHLRYHEPFPVLEKSVALHVYRIAQEAVSNAVKGGSKHIEIRLRKRKSKCLLVIADDGWGYRKKPIRSGMGLKMMEDRSHAIHGVFKIRSPRNGGTLVRCLFPHK